MERLAVYDRESSFASRLVQLMNEDESFPFYAEAFVTEEALCGAMESGRIDILVTDKPAWEEMVQKAGAGRVIVWSDVPGYSVIDGMPAVFKYQSAKLIQGEILRICEEARAVPAEVSAGRTKYIGVVSPVGRSFKTSFAVTLGQLLSERGKVLYASLEPYTAYEVFFGKPADYGFSNLLYVWNVKNTGINEDIHRIQGNYYGRFIEEFHGLSVLPPSEFPEDLYRTEPGQVWQVLTELVNEQGYDLVIMELGMDHRYLETFLPRMNKVYVPSRDDAVSQCKVQEFMRWAGRMDEFLYRKMETIIIPGHPVIPGGISQAEQVLWGGVGDYVRTMLAGMF